MMALGLLGFVAVGISLGMLGGGGSILAVPVLVHLLGLPASEAVPMSLPVVGAAAAVGAWTRWRRGQLALRSAAIFAVGTMVASFAAARLGADIPDRPRLLLFTGVMLVAATLMWRRAARRATPGTPVEADAKASPVRLVIAALAVGTLTGLVGVGGGFLIVPALVGVLGLAMPEATATSLAVIALNTGAASAGWWGRSTLDLRLTALVTVAALVGMAIGTRLAPRVSSATLSRAFAGLLLLVGAFMLVQEL
ncbi:MAG: sulfite exporter TauE/SafE family protein [Gemmatimonadales bacterium]